ncbi:hypothetical protein [Gymnodinialimonas hymeniacidonis]|uniref:hypothetical protein n=1 Tax=Gymnodinialimonas hymeniacidonis TaxID=3126508 RepID=UPI0034C6AEE9
MSQHNTHLLNSASYAAVEALHNAQQWATKATDLSKSIGEDPQHNFDVTTHTEETSSEIEQDSTSTHEMVDENDYARLAKLHVVDMNTLQRTTRDIFDTDQSLAIPRAAKAAEYFERLGELDPIQEMLLHQMISVNKVFIDCGMLAAVTPDNLDVNDRCVGKMVKLGNLYAKQAIVFNELRTN